MRVGRVRLGVVFANPLTEHQRTVLGEMFSRTVLSGDDLFKRDG
ncbi:hypothetical protein ACFQZ8_00875 [Micromonospora azadirachtae]|uniref:Uncharacterized protein n=1 Tax=Micromonospora azadirachtae TaxID=1970735 RepID=A0ABW2ZVQ7_9ACTN